MCLFHHFGKYGASTIKTPTVCKIPIPVISLQFGHFCTTLVPSIGRKNVVSITFSHRPDKANSVWSQQKLVCIKIPITLFSAISIFYTMDIQKVRNLHCQLHLFFLVYANILKLYTHMYIYRIVIPMKR